MDKAIRTETHEIDTAARALVPTLIGTNWEHRDVGGRDYGIDLQLERFEQGRATGNMLLLQIKGTRKIPDETDLYFDLPVKTLKYAEMFAVPFVLVVCPVEAMPHRAYFCWLQEYVNVILDFENPTWRANTATVRIRLNAQAQIPANNMVLEWIAQEPQRLRDWLKIATLQHGFKYLLPKLQVHEDDPIQDEDLVAAKEFVEKLKTLKSLYSHPAGYWLAHYMLLLDKSIDLMHRKGPYTLKDLKFAGAIDKLPPEMEQHISEDQTARMLLSLNLQTATDGLMTTLAQYFDDGLKRSGLMLTEAYYNPLAALKKLSADGDAT
jgi:hypothetical protein